MFRDFLQRLSDLSVARGLSSRADDVAGNCPVDDVGFAGHLISLGWQRVRKGFHPHQTAHPPIAARMAMT